MAGLDSLLQGFLQENQAQVQPVELQQDSSGTPSLSATLGQLFMELTEPQPPAPVSEDPDRQFSGSGVSIEDRFPKTFISDTIVDESTAPLSEVDPERRADEQFLRTGELPADENVIDATDVKRKDTESLEGPESVSSASVQKLQRQTGSVSRGDEGNSVFNAQLRLAELGYDIGRGGTAGLSKNAAGKWVSLDNSQIRGVDSDFGPSTEAAVRAFQTDAGLPVTGVIDEDTARSLASKESVDFTVPSDFTQNFSNTQNTNFNAAKEAAIEEGLEGAELASFMSQVAHESDSFRTAEEYASGSAYEGRADLGNTQVGDGVRYKGRGYIQLTGRSNYKKAGDALGLDLINNPSLAEEPSNAAAISLWFWKTKVKPQVPDFMDTERVTKVVNGGFNGLDDRKDYFDKFTKKWNETP
tara:strand:+ start:10681 stop:11922 length:1242 start_codon:yes stop_codon:yes gene_type:complete